MRSACIIALLAACAAPDDVAPTVELAGLALSPPNGWKAQEFDETTRMWSPVDNSRKESIVVIVAPRFLGTDERALAGVRKAQGVLRERRLLAETSVTTRGGLSGKRFDVQFRPDAGDGRLYERSHVSLSAGHHLVHVLYTAAQPDPHRTALNAVLESLKAGG